MPVLDIAPIHRHTSTVDAYNQPKNSVVDIRSAFVTRLLGRTGVLPMLIAILLSPTFLVYRVPVHFRMAFDQSSSVQPIIS
jgi:hypothetical protein